MRLDQHPRASRDRDPRILLPSTATAIRDVSPVVVTAKLAPPAAPAAALHRPRVSALLETATSRPLTIVATPAGYGRSTAIAAWAATTDAPCAWLALDEGDDDPRRLWVHLLAALDRVLPGAARTAGRALWLDEDLDRRVVPLTADALAVAVAQAASSGDHDGRQGPEPTVVLVLDDVHRVRAPASWRLLRALLDAAPAGLRVVASGRTAPPLRPARRRAAGLLSVLGADDLAFTREETTAFLDGVRRLRLPEAGLEAAWTRTAGWPVGLALLADATPRDPGRTRFADALEDTAVAMAAYVEEEVLQPAAAGLEAFLTRASVLEGPTGALCATVLDDPAAAGLLVRAREAGLLAGRGARERWRTPFRAGFLHALAHRDPDLLPTLHARAALVFEAAGRVGEAIAHATAAGDPVRASALAEAHVAALGGRPRPDGQGPRVATAWPWEGRVEEAVGGGSRALSGPDDPSPTVRATTAAALGQALWLAGDDPGALEVLQPRVGTMGHPAPRCWSLAVLALAAAGTDPERAGRLARHARRIAGRDGATWLEGVLAHQALADALRRLGDPTGARQALDRAAAATAPGGGLHHAVTLVLRAELDAATRDRRSAAATAAAARELLDLHPGAAGLASRLEALQPGLDRREDVLLGSDPTPAELRLLALLPTELSRREIGGELFVSVDTVKTHLRRLYRRLGVETRGEAVVAARDLGLLPPGS